MKSLWQLILLALPSFIYKTGKLKIMKRMQLAIKDFLLIFVITYNSLINIYNFPSRNMFAHEKVEHYF